MQFITLNASFSDNDQEIRNANAWRVSIYKRKEDKDEVLCRMETTFLETFKHREEGFNESTYSELL